MNTYTALPEYQPGDRVICVDAHGLDSLVEGQTYTVEQPGKYIFALEGVVSMQYTWRFTPVLPVPDLHPGDLDPSDPSPVPSPRGSID